MSSPGVLLNGDTSYNFRSCKLRYVHSPLHQHGLTMLNEKREMALEEKSFHISSKNVLEFQLSVDFHTYDSIAETLRFIVRVCVHAG